MAIAGSDVGFSKLKRSTIVFLVSDGSNREDSMRKH